jgi:hypothetical protein
MLDLHMDSAEERKLAQDEWLQADHWTYCCDWTDGVHYPLDDIHSAIPCFYRIDGLFGATESST